MKASKKIVQLEAHAWKKITTLLALLALVIAFVSRLFAASATDALVAESETLAVRIKLWTSECSGALNNAGACEQQKSDLMEALDAHADAAAAMLVNPSDWDVDYEKKIEAMERINPPYRLEYRAARYYADCLGSDDAECNAGLAALQEETARIIALRASGDPTGRLKSNGSCCSSTCLKRLHPKHQRKSMKRIFVRSCVQMCFTRGRVSLSQTNPISTLL
jgi:hypothetical protein